MSPYEVCLIFALLGLVFAVDCRYWERRRRREIVARRMAERLERGPGKPPLPYWFRHEID